MEYTITVTVEHDGQRLDKVLVSQLQMQGAGVSRTAVQGAIADGLVSCGERIVMRAHEKVHTGDVLQVVIPEKEQAALAPEDIPLTVVYDDDDLAVINKPCGLVVHPAPGNRRHTLVNALLFRYRALSTVNPERPGIVHRLDKDTSGLMVVVKNNKAHLQLARQFGDHTITRHYVAVVSGRVEYDEDIIEASIGRHPVKREQMAVSYHEEARYARTHYRTLKRTENCSLLDLEPFTGRTHQLRVHCAFIGHPIIGDSKYGITPFSRLALHARVLGFTHPRTGKTVEFSTDIPSEFLKLFD